MEGERRREKGREEREGTGGERGEGRREEEERGGGVGGRRGRRGGVDLDAGVEAEEVEHPLHVDERLPHITVHGAQEEQRHRQLEEQSVHHHQVSHCHSACKES